MTKRVMVPVGSRANYSSALPLMQAFVDVGLGVIPVAFASAMLDWYGDTAGMMERDGFPPRRLPCLSAGDTPGDMSRTTGAATVAFAQLLEVEQPDCVFVIGDRHEMLGPAVAAYHQGVHIAHSMGGEVSGTVDDVTRDMLTACATDHYVATKRAWARVEQTGAESCDVFLTGCPRIDWISRLIDVTKPRELDGRVIVAMHPDTDVGADDNHAMAMNVMSAVMHSRADSVAVIWPNADSHSDAIASAIREYSRAWNGISTYRKRSPEDYFRMLGSAGCIVGNSSSPIREGSYIGVPCVNVGHRQYARETAENVINVSGRDATEIRVAVDQQFARGKPYPSSTLYGDGSAAPKIARILKERI